MSVRKSENLTQVSDVPQDMLDRIAEKSGGIGEVPGNRLLVDTYFEICMCPDCFTLLEAPGGNLPSCSCGSSKLPLPEIVRLTVGVRCANKRVLNVFAVQTSPLTLTAVVFRENGVRSKHEFAMNPSYLTKYYEIEGLVRNGKKIAHSPENRKTIEGYGRLVAFLAQKLENVT